ncbi:XdhC family aldehyde oxidoreductase maturation factor [Parasporobacterium paucivorans]|uniref:Xanthine dehydrogenase accessory factor n=1 Tax=Parasporobacterium paucivorans DSM 15970 TaxID=1122934 RepID=A0A1M6LHL6_9FIRM|nr:XdhC/CoxI family protein [Parasporobacterium paucivorans]SHJ70648.1 xanthine dehydrogenase accessory factor [Parasporobacterium paucivorans DSM 15970]
MQDIFGHILEMLNCRQEMVMATIVSKSGSAPREAGTKMLIKKDFSTVGTIGGGLLEAAAIEWSSSVFDTKGLVVKDFALSNVDASAAGMVCGGDVKILLEYIDPFDENVVKNYEKAGELIKNGTDFVMITKVPHTKDCSSAGAKWICTDAGFHGIENEEIKRIAKSIREVYNNVKIKIFSDKEQYLAEVFSGFERVLIVGAGHVAQQFAELTKNLGFYTVIVDDRVEFANPERFRMADEIKVVSSFDNLSDNVTINPNSYIVILTRGHCSDKLVLAQVLKTDAKYIGMIGSQRKKTHTYGELLKEGFTTEDTERVYCPIGIDINAQTPAEIAICIAAEIIKVRRGMGLSPRSNLDTAKLLKND